MLMRMTHSQVLDPAHRRRRRACRGLRRGRRRAGRGRDLPPELTQDLVAYYPFDETSGTVVNDRSGKGNHAAIVNGNANTVWSNGRGLTLPGGNGGTSPAVRLPDSLLAGLSNVTIAFDVRLSSTTQQGQVFAFGRTADNAGYLAATPGAGTDPLLGVDRGSGREPGGPVGDRADGARRRTRSSTWRSRSRAATP